MSIMQRFKALFKSRKGQDSTRITVVVQTEASVVEDETTVEVPSPVVSPVSPAAEKVLPEYLSAAIHHPEVLALRPSLGLPRFHDDDEPMTPSSAYTNHTLFVTNSGINSISTAGTSLHSSSSSINDFTSRSSKPQLASTAFSLCLDDFTHIRGLGAGGFGSVYLVKHKPSGLKLALKAIDKRTCDHKGVLAEQKALLELATRGVNGIMELLGSFHNSRHYFFVTSYCPRGDLKSEIRRWGRLPTKLAKFYAAELLLAVQFIHDRGYLHRDIKPDNIFLTADGHLVLGDFGLAASLVPAGETWQPGTECKWFFQDLVGTLHYLAPEIWKAEPYSFSVDAWAFGVVVFEMLFGRTPWTGSLYDSMEVMDRHMQDETLEDWLGDEQPDKVTRSFLTGMLEKDAFDRPTLGEAQTHPFFKRMPWNKLSELPVPNVGTPPPKQDSRDSDVFVGSFGGGRVYTEDEDPVPKFNYISPALAAAVNPSASGCRKASSSSSHFVDIPLSDEQDLPSKSAQSPTTATSALNTRSPQILVKTTTEKCSIPIRDDHHSVQSLKDLKGLCGTEVAVQHKPLTILARLSAIVNKALKALKKICFSIPLRH